MNNDLISRKALKDDFLCRAIACTEWIAKAKDEEIKVRAIATKDFIDEVIMTINRAPAVEYPFYQEAYQTGYEEGRSDGIKIGKDQARKICDNCKIHERPQGEWICKTKSTFPQYQPDEYKCPFCGHIENRKTKFCCDCGADMKKGGVE